jgi:hypothetical protein
MLALGSSAWGLDWAPDLTADTTRILGDPAYLPLAGQVYGDFSYTYSAQTYDYQNNQYPGAIVYSWNKSGNDFLPHLAYGITDDISVSAALGWGNLRSTDVYTYTEYLFPPGGGVTTEPKQARVSYRSLGADNPQFAVTWRAIDQRTAPVNVDLSASYAPNIFVARDASVVNQGTIASGGQFAAFDASVSRETRVFTARGYVTFSYDGSRDVLQGTGLGRDVDTLRVGAHPEYTIGAQTETRPVPWAAINLGASASKSARFDDQTISPYFLEGSLTHKPGGTVTPYSGIVIPILPNRIAFELLYQHDFTGDEKVQFPYDRIGKYSEQGTNFYTARIRFVLF